MTSNALRSMFRVQFGLALFALWVLWPRVASTAWVNLGTTELSKAAVGEDVSQFEVARVHL